MACPSEDMALLFVRGELDREQALTVERHLDRCEHCYRTLTELARIFGSDLNSLRSVLAFAGTLTPSGALAFDSGVRHRPSDATGSQPDASMRELMPGGALGRYRIDTALGQGGMGRVFGAHDTLLQRPVALKLLRMGIATSVAAEQFVLSEARALARVEHPNVVRVYDAGVEDHQLYIAMELVVGRSLGAWARERRRSQQEVFGLVLGVADGLARLHETGLVHRDVKPDNIIVGHDGVARLTDFGLAQTQGGSGEFAGTPAYMSPEQLFARSVDARSDQFAFAAVVYELLSGRRPFVAESLEALKYAVAHRPEPLAVAGLPVAAAKAIERSLAFDPQARFPNMRALLAALRHELAAPHRTFLRLHTGFLAAHTLLHGLLIVWFWNLDKGPSSPTTSSATSALAEGGFSETLLQVFAIGIVIAAVLSLFWVPVGLLWAPLNAWGIAHTKRWARLSTLLYAAMGLLTCVGTPYAIFALITLTRPDVRRAFEEGDLDG